MDQDFTTTQENTEEKTEKEAIFEDFEAKSNLVGAFSILLKVYKRNPELYQDN